MCWKTYNSKNEQNSCLMLIIFLGKKPNTIIGQHVLSVIGLE